MKKVATIKGWFLEGINYSDAPSSMNELYSRFSSIEIDSSILARAPKWEPLIQGRSAVDQPGWVPLSDLATTRRGIATGANNFFLLSPMEVSRLGLPENVVVPCVGRATDVSGLVFDKSDLHDLEEKDAKCLLLDVKGPLDEATRAYIDLGERQELTKRYLLANRTPWYSMEQREPAPIWASVFGRGDLKFVYNAASARSLTNFHSIYPARHDLDFIRALTLALNSDVVRQGSRFHVRGYGGGLTKFEPNDLKSIMVPDLRVVGKETLTNMSKLLDDADMDHRQKAKADNFSNLVSAKVIDAGIEASNSSGTLF